MRQIYETIDRQGFQWVVVLVAGVGFFLDGYTLFASNIALPMIQYVYWQDDTSSRRTTLINIATLAGTLLGQVAFGFLADKNGRKKMYGVELVMLITATLGVVMASNGTHNSMSIYAWLLWWRVVVGIGVGADYPLSAVITSEFAPTKHRGRMMATVFFMQPLGQIAGNLVSLVVIACSRSQGEDDLVRTVDMMWRWVIGIGVVPGVIATFFRFIIPESPRYLLDIEDDPIKAEFDATTLFNDPVTPSASDMMDGWNNIPLPALSLSGVRSLDEDTVTCSPVDYATQPATLNSHWPLLKADLIRYFWTEGNWRILAATSFCWLLLDFGYYGISFSSPQFLAKTWGSLHLSGPAPSWETDDRANANVYLMFMNTSIHALVILNAGSFVGGMLFIMLAHKVDRVSLQKYGFLMLAALFIAMGVMFITVHTEGAPAVVLYILGELLFNLGPNATTYIIPAEIFPTRYRATCHGLSAASGKLGSILVQLFSTYYKFSGEGNAQTIRYGWVMIVFAACMILGAAVTHVWIPPVQRRQSGIARFWGGKPETLETLALGRLGAGSRYAVRNQASSRGVRTWVTVGE
ncbi:hypothetical protein ASPZODRAFT_1835693 [Penicilliopsis zonata CBS 506.65]|uniref:Major facilitator superfamily (MFS) profile domain-containing protein n=1 Tax=Penicilliopsis zonata CBS 506.65 TaxID=1073090 RepID=A0A1L9SHY1_9EURO|nr:hypothetical protein ASPZODRAFT_1835693 [Penicilliopsis zonata CBS 506.65]OJJ46822.1 hypothetical protein ASPZODRAFT_1835693 [Penicilliopsis zonata CBS 506.65]